jgi:hypothetical protein
MIRVGEVDHMCRGSALLMSSNVSQSKLRGNESTPGRTRTCDPLLRSPFLAKPKTQISSGKLSLLIQAVAVGLVKSVESC